jgi:hypothetical protein
MWLKIKSSILAQNLENKGPEFFLPSRSMVLKVVRGKILETLELLRFSAACDWFLEAARRSWRRLEVLRFHQDGSWLAEIGTAQKACGRKKNSSFPPKI